jgi:hypothetical protein
VPALRCRFADVAKLVQLTGTALHPLLQGPCTPGFVASAKHSRAHEGRPRRSRALAAGLQFLRVLSRAQPVLTFLSRRPYPVQRCQMAHTIMSARSLTTTTWPLRPQATSKPSQLRYMTLQPSRDANRNGPAIADMICHGQASAGFGRGLRGCTAGFACLRAPGVRVPDPTMGLEPPEQDPLEVSILSLECRVLHSLPELLLGPRQGALYADWLADDSVTGESHPLAPGE